jgi:alpha-glucosidase
MKRKVWPGECNRLYQSKVREWWAGLFKELISDIKVCGMMNEPAVMEVPNKTFPMDVRHDYDGNPCSHRKAHNIYGTQMARATYHGKTFCYPKDLLLLRDQLMLERNATPPHGQEIIHMGNIYG